MWYSWARHFTFTVPLSTMYKWVTANLMRGSNPVMNQHPIQGGVEIFLPISCFILQVLRPEIRTDGPLCLNTNFSFNILYECLWTYYPLILHDKPLNLIIIQFFVRKWGGWASFTCKSLNLTCHKFFAFQKILIFVYLFVCK